MSVDGDYKDVHVQVCIVNPCTNMRDEAIFDGKDVTRRGRSVHHEASDGEVLG